MSQTSTEPAVEVLVPVVEMNKGGPTRLWKLSAAVLFCLASLCFVGQGIWWFAEKERWIDDYRSWRESQKPEQVARRKAMEEREREERQQRERIERVIKYTAGLLTHLEGRYDTLRKLDHITYRIDLSGWRGADRDLSLLRVFLLLDDNDREDRTDSYFHLELGPKTTDRSLRYLADLTNLRALILHQAAITDAGLDHLQKLTRLSDLDLSGSSVTDQCFERLNALVELDHLGLEGTKVTLAGVVRFADSRPTVRVVFSGGYMYGRRLDLSGPSADDDLFRQLTALQRYHRIYLGFSKVSDDGLCALEGQSELKDLGLEAPPITDAGLKQLRGLNGLERLWWTGAITDSGLQELEGLTTLKLLHLDHTAITDAGLIHLKRLDKLDELSLRYTGVTDAGLEHLKTLTNLREFSRYGTKMSKVRAKEFQRQMPQLKDVH